MRLVQPNQLASELLAGHAHVLQARAVRQAGELGGREGVDVDHPLQRGVGLIVLVGRRGARADRATPQRRDGAREPLRHARQAVAVAGGLAGEQQRAAGSEHALELGERAREVGDVVQHGVAEHEVEAPVREGQALGVGGLGLHLAARTPRVVLEDRQHARRDVAAGGLCDHAGAAACSA